MKRIKLILSIVLLVGCSSNKIVYKEVLTYHELTKEQRSIHGKVVKEKFTMDRKKGLNHGSYERYNLNYLTLEKGDYKDGKRYGLWKIWNEEDQIYIVKNYQNNGEESPLIEKRYLQYPMGLVEARDTIPQGYVKMKFLFDENCNLLSLEIVEGIDDEFNNEIASEYKRYARLCNKYAIPIDECINKTVTLKIKFAL